MKRATEGRVLISPWVTVLTVTCWLLVAALGSAQEAKPTQQKPQTVTFARDIAPIVFRSCSSCHHAGEAGPFPLVTYGDVKSHARQIADVTRKRLMPPWLPSTDGPKFAEDAHLSGHDIAILEKWVDAGMPEGNPAEAPPAPKFASGWQLGQPDLVLRAQTPFTIPASGSDVYWNFIFRSPVNLSRFVKAIEKESRATL